MAGRESGASIYDVWRRPQGGTVFMRIGVTPATVFEDSSEGGADYEVTWSR